MAIDALILLFNIKAKKLRKKPRTRIEVNKLPVNSAKNLFAEMAINQPNQTCGFKTSLICLIKPNLCIWQQFLQQTRVFFYQKLKFELEDFNNSPNQGELIEANCTSNSLLQSHIHPQHFKDAANNLLPKIQSSRKFKTLDRFHGKTRRKF